MELLKIDNLNKTILAQNEAIQNLNLTTSAIEEAQKKNEYRFSRRLSRIRLDVHDGRGKPLLRVLR